MNLVKAEMKVHDGMDEPKLTAYHEETLNKTRFVVTSVYKGEIDFAKAMEGLIVKKILRSEGLSKMTEPDTG
jgi:hypothetical protein